MEAIGHAGSALGILATDGVVIAGKDSNLIYTTFIIFYLGGLIFSRKEICFKAFGYPQNKWKNVQIRWPYSLCCCWFAKFFVLPFPFNLSLVVISNRNHFWCKHPHSICQTRSTKIPVYISSIILNALCYICWSYLYIIKLIPPPKRILNLLNNWFRGYVIWNKATHNLEVISLGLSFLGGGGESSFNVKTLFPFFYFSLFFLFLSLSLIRFTSVWCLILVCWVGSSLWLPIVSQWS